MVEGAVCKGGDLYGRKGRDNGKERGYPMRTFGIDISRWQGDFDLRRAVKEGVRFVILKGGGGDDGLYVDGKFEENYRKAKELGLPVGCYWFSKALTETEGRKEAQYFYDHVLKGRQFELPVYMDVENRTQLALGKRRLTDVVKAWCAELEKRNMVPGIYSSRSYFSSYLYDRELTMYPHWVAAWSKSCQFTPESCFGMWQFGGETNLIRSNKVAGVVCDQDYMLIDYPAIIKREGKNGFSAGSGSGAANPVKEVCRVSLPVLRRNSRSGYVRTAQILLNAYNGASLVTDGIFGPATEKAVRDYQRSRSLAVDGIIGAATWAQLLK